MKLSDGQKKAIAGMAGNEPGFGEDEILGVVAARTPEGLSTERLFAFPRAANAAYPAGEPIIDDAQYDHVSRPRLEARAPDHPFLHEVEQDVVLGKTVELPARMLSTQKAYTTKELQAWLDRLEKAGVAEGLRPTMDKATPKLDGLAAYDDGERLYSRDDGKWGSDISRVFERGLKVGGNGVRGQGPGEIVVGKSYFEAFMAAHFDNSRNVQAAILAEKKVDPIIQRAIDEGAALSMPFVQLQAWTGKTGEVVAAIGPILEEFREKVELTSMAWCSRHRMPRSGIRSEARAPSMADCLQGQRRGRAGGGGGGVLPNTSRLGRVNPVAVIEAIRVRGVMIGRVTAHHYGLVRARGIGPGARIKIVRSGSWCLSPCRLPLGIVQVGVRR